MQIRQNSLTIKRIIYCAFKLTKYPKTIEEILSNSSNPKIIEKLRLEIKNTISNIKESVRRGDIIYRLNDKDFLRIRSYKNHADLGFVNGTRIASILLKKRGKGTSWRHVELKTPDEVENPEIKRLLKRVL